MMFYPTKCIQPFFVKTFQFCSNKRLHLLRSYCKSPATENEVTVGGLAKALEKFRELEKGDPKDLKTVEEEKSFLYLLRHSEFVQMGDPPGKVVIGKIFQVVNTDLYIDFGGKFYCVCRRPKKNSQLYVRNARVKLRINELELCARFLGAVEDLTLTEASGSLLDLVWTPVGTKKEVGTPVGTKAEVGTPVGTKTEVGTPVGTKNEVGNEKVVCFP